jgi:hypothetical protein
LDCATRPDQLLAVKPESYGKAGFRIRYLYPVMPGREANILNALAPENWVTLVLYHVDERSAALLEVGFEGREAKRTYTLLDGANLEKKNGRWMVRNILNGAGSTWPEIAQHAEQLSQVPLITVARADVKRTGAVCQFPLSGLTFVAASVDGDRSNWKFKDDVSEGIPFQSQSGPFKNNNLKRTPSSTIFMNTYGPS